MHLSFHINSSDLQAFIDHWSARYKYPWQHKYDDHIGLPLTTDSRLALFEWKNGSIISARKLKSIDQNYPQRFEGDRVGRYLNHQQPGGAIWNIFYLHCLSPSDWPIYDQHTHRAMKFMTTGQIVEIGSTKKQKYACYLEEFMPFLASMGDFDGRTLDKALFAFGQFLKLAKHYT